MHTIYAAKLWFKENELRVMEWPTLFSDLNSTEHILEWLEGSVFAANRHFFQFLP